MSLNYTTVDGFVKWVSSDFAGILSDDIPSSFDPSTDDAKAIIEEALETAESDVDGALRLGGYSVPVSKTNYPRSYLILRNYARDIAVYLLYGRRGITKEQYYKYTQVRRELKDFTDNKRGFPENVSRYGEKKLALGEMYGSVYNSSKDENLKAL